MQHRSRSHPRVLAPDAAAQRRSLRTLALLQTGAVVLCASAVTPADALPADTSTGPSTTGTASTVSPSTIAVGGTLTYTLSGFPKDSTVQVLVDDGGLDTQDPVVSETPVDEHGTTSGHIELPAYVDEGTHWLRFRVSAGADVPTSQVRTADYTNKSPYFTVAGVTIIGGGDSAATAQPTATGVPTVPAPSVTATSDAEAADASASSGRSEPHGFPVIGASFLGLGIIMVGLAGFVVRNRRRLAAHERALAEQR